MSRTYQIVRFFVERGRQREVREKGLTLEQASTHCRNPKTTTDQWFDGYEVEPKKEEEEGT